jgi:hypothetical protein
MRRWLITTVATAVVSFVVRKIGERRDRNGGRGGSRRRR